MRGIQRLISIASAILLAVGFATPAAANNPALVPTFGTPIPIAGGFAVQITNHDANFTYTAIGSDCSIATVNGGWLSVSGVLPSQTVKARVFTNQAGYDEGMAVVSGSSAAFSPRGQVELNTSYVSYSNHAVGPDGELYVAWATGSTVANLSKSIDGGQTWALVKSWTLQNFASQISVGVAVDTDGDLAMVWQEGPNNSYKVMVSTSSDGGSTWITPVQLNAGQNTQLVSVQFSPSGDVLVSWNVYDGTAFVSPFRVSSNMGATWTAMANSSSPTEASFYPSLVKLSTGQIAMIWVNGAGIRAAMFDDTTNTFAASAVITPANIDIYQINFSADSSGNLVAAWTAGGFGSKSVQFSVFNGSTWSTAETVSTAPGDYSMPNITKTQTSITVAWEDASNAARIRTTTSLSPLTWGAEVSPSPATADLYQVKTTSFAPGKLATTWLRKSAINNYYHLDLVTSNDDGATWSTPIQISTHNDNNYQPIFMPNGLGQLAVLWRIQYSSSMSLKTAVLASTLPPESRSIYQVAEINPGAGHSSIYDMAILNNKMYLIAKHIDTGFELFEFDGTQMRLVQDLLPGAGNGLYDTQFIAKTPTALYFQGTDGVTGYEIYKFDGSTISLAANINPAVTTPSDETGQIFQGSMPGSSGSAVIGNRLFFSSSYPSWGTSYVLNLATPNAIPQRLSDYFTGFTASGFGSSVVIGSTLYFVADDFVYATDGVATPTAIPGTYDKAIQQLGSLGSKLLISGSTSGSFADIELMSWDPASPSTPAALAANINPFSGSGFTGSLPIGFVNRCGETYFTASSGSGDVMDNRELWKWDGFEATQVKDFWTGAANSGRPQSITAIGNELFMFAQGPSTGFEMWRTSGSETTMLPELRAGSDSSISGAPPFVSWNNQIYTSLWGPTGIELYAYGVQPQNHQVVTFAMNYTITYDANGGSGGSTATHPAGSVTLPNGSSLNLAGKVFAGWDTSSTATTATYAAGASYNLAASTTLYAVWSDPPAQQGATSSTPTLSLPGGAATAVSGGDLKLSGENLGGVTAAEIDSKNAPIKDKSDSSLTIALPELKTGVYDLTLKAASGSLTLQGAVRVISGSLGLTPEAAATIQTWTKMSKSRTSIQMVAKNPVGAGKVQFLVNGKEVRWLRARSAADPKLFNAVVDGVSQSYLRTRVALREGKNVFEILVNGKRTWRASYTSR
jgi:ELWxxDGT repeat protein